MRCLLAVLVSKSEPSKFSNRGMLMRRLQGSSSQAPATGIHKGMLVIQQYSQFDPYPLQLHAKCLGSERGMKEAGEPSKDELITLAESYRPNAYDNGLHGFRKPMHMSATGCS